jgi:hypothetical protein
MNNNARSLLLCAFGSLVGNGEQHRMSTLKQCLSIGLILHQWRMTTKLFASVQAKKSACLGWSAAHEDRHSHATACDIIVDRIDEIVVAEEQSVSCSFVSPIANHTMQSTLTRSLVRAVARPDAFRRPMMTISSTPSSSSSATLPHSSSFVMMTPFLSVNAAPTAWQIPVAMECDQWSKKKKVIYFKKKKKNVKLFRFINELSQMVKKKHQKRQKNKQISLRYRG